MSDVKTDPKKGVKVSIAGRSFTIACNDSERAILDAASHLVETKLEQVQNTGKIVGMDRCAILVALNLASELLIQRGEESKIGKLETKIASIKEKIDAAIQEQNQLSL